MIANIDQISGLVSATVAILGLFIAVVALLFVRQQRRESDLLSELRERDYHSQVRNEAIIDRIRDLERELVRNSKDFREVNHLLIDAQKERSVEADARPRRNTFLSELGIETSNVAVDPKYVFVLTPFLESEKNVYALVVRVLSAYGLRVSRGDELQASGEILPHIVENILRARLVIANVEGRNPNVMYELGIAHALGKDVVLIAGSQDNVPFDLRNKRIILYSNPTQLSEGLRRSIIGRYFSESET
ncbi:MAG: hypothetical protein RIE24_16615 [Silicimonas sp.]